MALFPCVVCLQMEIQPGDIAANLHSFEELLAGQPLPENTLVVLPELWATGFAYPRLAMLAARTPQILSRLQQLAARHRIWFAGSLVEQQQQGAPCNTLFVSGPEGVVGRYRKQHLFTPWQEEEFFQAGTASSPVATPFGQLGALVCYDLRFPEISRGQVFSGCRLLVVSAQWPAIRLDHWQLLVRARAVENQAFVVACNGCGICGENALAGNSMIVDPDGLVLARAGKDAMVLSAELQEDKLETVRSRFCSAAERPWPVNDGDKVLEVASLKPRLDRLRNQGSTIVFTNGCFDLLHAGHVSYLEQARRCGDCLVVGLNSDRSVQALKGNSRPINREQDRARVLAALGCVDFIVLFDEDTPRALISDLLPDVLVKGVDWPEDQIAGAAEVKAAGGRVERIVFEHQISTSGVINKIQNQAICRSAKKMRR